MVSNRSNIEIVILHTPLSFDGESSTKDDTKKELVSDKDQSDRRLVFNTANKDTGSWRRFDAEEFKPLTDENNCVVLKYSQPPPDISSSSLSLKDDDSIDEVDATESEPLWCTSSITRKKNLYEFAPTNSPTDFFRYKTRIVLKGNKEEWNVIWKKLKRSLQSGSLEFCNAYYKDRQEIMIYHYGWQQAQIGEWIWKNVSLKYSRLSRLVHSAID